MPYVRRRTLKRRRAAPARAVKRARSIGYSRNRSGYFVRRSRMPQRRNVSLGLGFPKIVKMTHRYSETIRMVSSAGVPQFQRFRANGMYDPNQTAGGHQPLFYDQMSVLYNHWKVIGARLPLHSFLRLLLLFLNMWVSSQMMT